MPPVIEIEGLTKDYQAGFWVKRTVRALDSLDLTVEAGEIFGFLGPNGAGKTTTLKLLMRIIHPSAGRARILGLPLGHPDLYRRIGYLPEQPYFYDYLTAEELLEYFGRLFGLDGDTIRAKVDSLLPMVGLADAGKVQLRKFSKGMMQRIGIAQAILNEPQVLFLDEPFSGLDPIGRRELRDLVRSLNRTGVTIFFSSHILSDVESLCDRFAILHRGRLRDTGALQQALRGQSDSLEVIATGLPETARAGLADHAQDIAILGDRMKLIVSGRGGIGAVARAIEAAGGRVLAVNPVRPSLEELFMRQIETEERTAEATRT